MKKTGLIILLIALATTIQAKRTLELTQGHDSRIPVTVVKFSGNALVSQIINDDLDHSGQFIMQYQTSGEMPHSASEVMPAFWRNQGVNDVIVGQVTPVSDDRYQVTFSLIDLFSQAQDSSPVLVSKRYTVSSRQLRLVAHAISDAVYYQLTGLRGAFSTRIAYVLEKQTDMGTRYYLNVADYDGANVQSVVSSSAPLLSPRWSPDGHQIAYVSFGKRGSEIYLLNVVTGQRILLLHFPGLNAAPAWSPDGRQLAVTLSRSGTQNIYLFTLANKRLQQLTDDASIDTEPCFTPDGKSLFFVSNRHETPEIYRYDLDSGDVTRITYDGDYNLSPHVTPDGKMIVFIHQDNDSYVVAKQELQSGTLTMLTDAGLAQSPSIAPNGGMIIYSDQSGVGRLAIVSANGLSHWQLPGLNGNMQEPSWSPLR